jgi:MFS family permease
MTGVWPSLAVTLAIQVLAALVLYVPPVLAPAAQAEVGVRAAAVGVVTALIFAAATFAALRSGPAIARHGALRVSQLSLVLCAGGLAIMTTANAVWIGLGALVIGLGYGVVTPSSSSILADRAPQRLRALIFSVKQTGVPVAGALAGATLPALVVLWGWRSAALCACAACIVLAVGLEPLRPAMESERSSIAIPRTSMLSALRLLFRHRRLWELSLAAFMFAGMQNCLASYLVIYLQERIGFGLAAAGLALSTAMAAGIVGRIFWGVVADRWQSRPLLGWIGAGMSAAAVLTAAIAPQWPAAAVLAVSLIFGATAVGWNGVFLAEVAHLVPARETGTATGAALAMTYAGVVILPLLFLGLVRLFDSYAIAYCASAALTLWRSLVLIRPAPPR